MTTPQQQPLLTSVFQHCYGKTFGNLDHEDDARERSANEAMLKEVYESIQAGDMKWVDDLWFPALVKFAYGTDEINEDDTNIVLKQFFKLCAKEALGDVSAVSVEDVILLKSGLLSSKVHLCHDTVSKFLLKGYPLVQNLPADATLHTLSSIAKDLVSKMPHHLCWPAHLDPLLEANNFFILRHLKKCQLVMNSDFSRLEYKLAILERRTDGFQAYIVQQVMMHHNLPGILGELGSTGVDVGDAGALQLSIIHLFAGFVRDQFVARYPTVCLFLGEDLDQQLGIWDVNVSDLEDDSGLSATENGTDDEEDDDDEGGSDDEDEDDDLGSDDDEDMEDAKLFC